jgi:zinc protease
MSAVAFSVISAGAATAVTAQASTTSGDILPFKATERTLPNGLKVIIVPTGFPNIVSLQIPVQTGSRNEVEPGKSGFAHFFEHIMFRGTKNQTQEDMMRTVTKAGARENAYTTDDFTNYYITFAKEDLDAMIGLQADRFQNLQYPEAEFKTEARAVLGEYNKNSANPVSKLFEALRSAAFSKHTYAHTTMGFIKDIEDMPNQYEYSKEFFSRWYRPEYTTIIVAGDVTADEVMPLIEKHWGKWERGSYKAEIPQEPAGTGPKYTHVNWTSPTLPYLAVAFRNPAFSETNKDNAALDFVSTLWFGPTSEIYKKLVQREQKVDGFSAGNTSNADPELFTIFARLKKPEDAVYVRDEILKTIAQAKSTLVSADQLAATKSNAKYSFVRSLDNTDRIASTLARFVRFNRSYNTINKAYALYDQLTPEDLRSAAQRYFIDNTMVVATVSNAALPAAISTLPAISSFAAAQPAAAVAASNGNAAGKGMKPGAPRDTRPWQVATAGVPAANGTAAKSIAADKVIVQKSPLPQLRFKVLFTAGSSHDPVGKEGLASLSARMIAGAGSKSMTLEDINRALYPVAGSFGAQVDKEMTTFTGSIHKDNWDQFVGVTLPMLLEPGFREEDFKRNRDGLLNSLKQDLIANNEEELGKERLQGNIYAGTRYAHPVQGTIAGIESITLDDVRNFIRDQYTQGNLMLAVNGDISDARVGELRAALATLPAGTAPAKREPLAGKRVKGLDVEIIDKDTRATAISFGLPLEVTRTHPDFAALNVARSWLGEHRLNGRLYDQLRRIRGLNYGDYSYIEAFPRGMFQFFPDPNIARRGQIFEVWIRPVVPENAHMSLRIALHELDQLIQNGMSEEDFQASRQYLMKNVYVMTQTQDQQVGYALDSKWYGMPEYTAYMRQQLEKLTREDVNRALKKHLSAQNLSVVMITDDAEGLKAQLVADGVSSIKYDGEKPQSVLDEDKVIGARKLNITADRVKITPVAEVFAK